MNKQRVSTAPCLGFGERGFTVISDLDRLPILLPKLYLNLTGNPA